MFGDACKQGSAHGKVVVPVVVANGGGKDKCTAPVCVGHDFELP